MTPPRPTPAFANVSLEIFRIPPHRAFGRIYQARYPDALGVGKTPSRFSDPRRRVAANRFSVLYLGGTFSVCFLEAILRDERDGLVGDWPLDERELDLWAYAQISTQRELNLVDLRDDSPVRMGVPSDVAKASNQNLGRQWALAIHEHPQRPDGIIYPSRLNGETDLAVFGRAIPKLRTESVTILRRAPGLAAVLDQFRVALA